MKQTTLGELAALVGGELVGEAGLAISGAAPLYEAIAGQISLVDGAQKGRSTQECRASAVVAPRGHDAGGVAAIRVDDVHAAFRAIIEHFRPVRPAPPAAVSPLASVHPTARLGKGVDVQPFAVIDEDVEIGDGAVIHSGVRIMAGCRIGAGTTIFSNAVLYENTEVGPRCILHAGAVLGAYGFGYSVVGGRHQLSAQLGNVVLEADVEIGANTTVDRGTYGSTRIGEGTKIDNQVMVAHNCRIGKHNLLCSQVGIAGSTSTGDYVVMAGQAGVRDHVHIGNGAVLGAMAGVMGDVPDGARIVGIPATPEREQMLKQVAWAKLPEMRKEFKALQATVASLKERANAGGSGGE